MKKFSLSVIAILSLALVSLIHAQIVEPSSIIIDGQKFYYHDVKKGESIYGIANQYGWSPEKLTSFNAESASKIKAGMRLFYPDAAGNISVEDEWISSRPLIHILEPGENVYTLSSLYNVSVDSLYAMNPMLAHGTVAGDTILVKRGNDSFAGASKLIYTVKPGDTLSSIARNFHTTVASLFAVNPGLKPEELAVGKEIMVVPDNVEVKTRVIKKSGVSALNSYKVNKDESWYSIANSHNINQETLMAANPGITELKKNTLIAIPKFDTVSIAERYIDYDPREMTIEGLKEIAEDVKNNSAGGFGDFTQPANIALVVSNANANINMEFTRGFLVALNEFKHTPFSVNFTVIDQSATPHLINDSVMEKFNIVVTTYDKNIPASLVSATEKAGVPLVNVFDVKSELYKKSPNQIQMLPPSDDFNNIAANAISSKLADKTVIFLGEVDPNDVIASVIRTNLADNCVYVNTVEDLMNRTYAEGMDYVIYCSENGRDRNAINNSLSKIQEVRLNNPFANITTLGRPAWVQQINALNAVMAGANTVIPSRFYFDNSEEASRRFLTEYHEMFHHTPVSSSPMFAVAGYDVARFFIPALAMGNIAKDKFVPESDYKMLQTDFNLRKYSPEGGYLNSSCYLIKIRPYGIIEKELLKE